MKLNLFRLLSHFSKWSTLVSESHTSQTLLCIYYININIQVIYTSFVFILEKCCVWIFHIIVSLMKWILHQILCQHYFTASVRQHTFSTVSLTLHSWLLSVRPGQLVVGLHIYSYITAGCQQITGLSWDCARVETLLPTILIILKPQEFCPPKACLLSMYLNLRGTGCLYVTPW